MYVSSDFRRMAREALKGKWFLAVVVGLVAALLTGIGPEVKFNMDASGLHTSLKLAGQTIFSSYHSSPSPFLQTLLAGGAAILAAVVLVLAVVWFILGGFVGVGWARFNLNLADWQEAGFDDLFAYARYWKTTALAKLLRTVYIFLWSLLLVVPGILAAYSYAMTDYILAEHPDWTAQQALACSKQLMEGNRWRLFCLQVSFIGWDILACFTFGIGSAVLRPYKKTAEAAFYRDVSRVIIL